MNVTLSDLQHHQNAFPFSSTYTLTHLININLSNLQCHNNTFPFSCLYYYTLTQLVTVSLSHLQITTTFSLYFQLPKHAHTAGECHLGRSASCHHNTFPLNCPNTLLLPQIPLQLSMHTHTAGKHHLLQSAKSL